MYTFRPTHASDDLAILELHSQLEPEGAPLSLAHLQELRSARRCDEDSEQWAAVSGNELVGMASFSPAWWTGERGTYAVEILVASGHQGCGVGSQLLNLMEARLRPHQAKRLLSWLREDASHSRAFTARRGFLETGQEIREYRLYVPEARLEGWHDLEPRLRASGLRIAALADLPYSREAFLRSLQLLWADSGAETPDADRLRESLPRWLREVIHGPGLSSETHWVALEGERPVGMSFLRRLSESAAENDYTGVAASHRGRGIATILKVRAVEWARRHGVSWFYTSSETRNAPMLQLNRRLGYQPTYRRLEVAKELTG